MTLLSVRSTADLTYGYALSSAFRSQYVYDPSFALAREPDIWELVQNDAVVKSAMDRSGKATVRPWRMEPFDGSKDKPDRQICAVIKDGLRNITRFNRRRRRISEARILGRTYGVILWQRRSMSLGGSPEMDWYVPYEIVDVDRRRFHWAADWKDGVKTGVHLEMWNTNTGRWELLPPELRGSMIEYIYQDTEDRVGNGRGLIEPTYFYHYMKTVTFEKISQGIDRWANGVWIGTLDGLRNASTGKTNEALRQGMLQVMETMRSQHVAVLEKVDDIKVLETSGTGHQISIDFVRYLDESIERLYNGSVRPAGHSVGGTGSKSAGQTEQDETESFFQEEREDLDSVFGRDLVGAFIRNNRPQLERMGLAKARKPAFTSEQIKKQDPKTAVEVMNAAKVPLSMRQYYEKIECEQPDDDEEIVEPTPMGDDGSSFADLGVPGVGKKSSKTISTGSGPKKQSRGDMAAAFEAQEERIVAFQADQGARFDRIERLVERIAVTPAPQPITINQAAAPAPVPPPAINLTAHVANSDRTQDGIVKALEGQATTMREVAGEMAKFREAIPQPPEPKTPVVNFNPTIHIPVGPAPIAQFEAPKQAPPVVNFTPMINVPQGPAPVAKFEVHAAPTPNVVIEDKSSDALGRIATAVEGAVAWVKGFLGNKKPAPVAKDITFKTDGGRIVGAEVKPKD